MAQDNSDEIAPPGKEESKTATPVVLPKKRKRTKSKKARTSINNPLAGRPPARLKDDVHRFAEKYELQNISDLLYRGARVAQDPGEFESDDPPASESEEPPVSESALELSKEEREALRVERKSTFWQQTKELKVIVVTCSIAAILQGWDQASINGLPTLLFQSKNFD
ncbi:MAG: hypothetical protein M1839_002867 [Geoglossum umbratile]|nr:MAG: hypothetical protein M1839_002867 [Geoglossum umbratile]